MKTQDKGERPFSDRLWDRIKSAYGLSASLSDEKWARIAKDSGLPEKARSYVEYSIARYWRWGSGLEVMPSKIKKKLRKLRNQAKELLEDFEEVLGTAFFLGQPEEWYLPEEWHPRNFEHRVGRTSTRSAPALSKKLGKAPVMMKEYEKFAEQVRADLKTLIDWLDQSERAIGRRKPGRRPPQRVWLFVGSINNALRDYTGKRLTRSDHHREMMKAIFAIIDPKVGKGTIDTAMKEVIIDARKRSDSPDFGNSFRRRSQEDWRGPTRAPTRRRSFDAGWS
jgi:hypothetical protein